MGALGPHCIQLSVNGEIRQKANLSDMVWSVPEIVAHLSRFYHLVPGDLIMTGTPAGVGALQSGDTCTVAIEGLGEISTTIVDPL